MKLKVILIVLILMQGLTFAQEDLLNEIDTANVEELYQPSFKGLQIVTGQSTKMPAKKEFYFVVAHRFGDVSKGLDNFFGLDNATTEIGGIYGITEGFAVNLSRHTYKKTYEIGGKYRLMKQSEAHKTPFDVVGYHVVDINSELDKDIFPNIKFSDRLSYTSQILISRRFNENFSLQVSPSFVHRNLIDPSLENDNNFLTGIGGRYKISKRVSINAEYFYNFNDKDFYKNPLSIGMDLETGGHVFQLLFTNSQPNTEAGYLTNAIGDWGKGKVFFGFNLYRVF